jgi:hypothetical protein
MSLYVTIYAAFMEYHQLKFCPDMSWKSKVDVFERKIYNKIFSQIKILGQLYTFNFFQPPEIIIR